MTGPSSGDRPAEEKWNGRSSPECTPRCGTRGTSRIVHDHATPPAVRTGDDAATVEQDALPWDVDPLDSHRVVDRDGYGVATAFAAPDAARIVALANTALSTPPPVSGTATRDDVIERLGYLLAEHDGYSVNAAGQVVCVCGHAIVDDDDDGSHAWHVADVLVAAELLALGGSQPAAQADEPAGYREAWDAWTEAVQAGESIERQRELWAAVNDVLDRAEIRAAQIEMLTTGIDGPDCEIPAQPVQPAEEQRPIDLLTGQGDAGLRARVEALVEEVETAHAEAQANAAGFQDEIVRNQYVGRAWGLADALSDLRHLLDGEQ